MKFSGLLKEVRRITEASDGVKLFLIIPTDYVEGDKMGDVIDKIQSMDTDNEVAGFLKELVEDIISRAGIRTGHRFGKLLSYEAAIALPILFDSAEGLNKVISAKEYDDSDSVESFKKLFTAKQLKNSDIYSSRT